MIEAARWIVILFGLYLILVGILMYFRPKKARATLRKAGSTRPIHYGELTLRLIPACAMILCAGISRHPVAFITFGWFMIATSAVLSMMPRAWHHAFSMKCADILQPKYWKRISPFACLFGVLIMYTVW